jgi:hypothetical protein
MMVVKTDFVPVWKGQYAIHQTRKVPAVKFISDAGLAILTFFAVFSGLLRSQENLEKMGVSSGPNHL